MGTRYSTEGEVKLRVQFTLHDDYANRSYLTIYDVDRIVEAAVRNALAGIERVRLDDIKTEAKELP